MMSPINKRSPQQLLAIMIYVVVLSLGESEVIAQKEKYKNTCILFKLSNVAKCSCLYYSVIKFMFTLLFKFWSLKPFV